MSSQLVNDKKYTIMLTTVAIVVNGKVYALWRTTYLAVYFAKQIMKMRGKVLQYLRLDRLEFVLHLLVANIDDKTNPGVGVLIAHDDSYPTS